MAKNPKVTIGLILFKGEKYLRHSLPSLIDQDYKNIEFLFRDQSPNGEVYEYIKRELPDIAKKVRLEKGGNLWHSGGHNALIRKMIRHGGDYYFCCSNDMLYPKDFVSKAVEVMEKRENKRFGSATCKLMRWNFEEDLKTDVIDSFGIGITKGHYFFDIGQSETNQSPYLSDLEIFGPSGALAIYRKEALEDIAFTNEKGEKEYFDELLHYKNDVDLAYRLQWAGYPCLFIPQVTVYHDRQVGLTYRGNHTIVNKIVSHAHKSKWAKGNSFFGHLVTLEKNFTKEFSWGVRLKTWISRLLRVIYTVFLDANLLKQYRLMGKLKHEINSKQKAITKRVSPARIEKLMN